MPLLLNELQRQRDINANQAEALGKLSGQVEALFKLLRTEAKRPRFGEMNEPAADHSTGSFMGFAVATGRNLRTLASPTTPGTLARPMLRSSSSRQDSACCPDWRGCWRRSACR